MSTYETQLSERIEKLRQKEEEKRKREEEEQRIKGDMELALQLQQEEEEHEQHSYSPGPRSNGTHSPVGNGNPVGFFGGGSSVNPNPVGTFFGGSSVNPNPVGFFNDLGTFGTHLRDRQNPLNTHFHDYSPLGTILRNGSHSPDMEDDIQIEPFHTIFSRMGPMNLGNNFFPPMVPLSNIGGIPMSYENLLNLQPVPTPAKNLDQLPQFNFKKKTDSKDSNSSSECSICLTQYDEGDMVKLLPCTHRFHGDCIDRWLVENNTCPICKTKVDS